MNIHFTSQNLFEQLIKSSLVKIEVGSYLYGTKNENSDTDYLCIYVPSIEETNSFSFSHHQYQYKDIENNIDYVFTSLPNFIRNILTGDSTMNFEVIHSKQLMGSCLDFLYKYRDWFYSYPVIRAYLGFARRDLKHVNKGVSNYEKNKRLLHAIRGLYFAYGVAVDSFSLQFTTTLFSIDDELTDVERKKHIDHFSEKIENYRKVVNEKLENGEIIRFMIPKDQYFLDNHLSSLYKKEEYLVKKRESFHSLMRLTYEANEKGVTY